MSKTTENRHYTEEYDEELKSIDFYRIHQELLPYIGSQFKTAKRKILLIGESHYINDYWRVEENWENYDLLLKIWGQKDWHEILMPNQYDKDGKNLGKKDKDYESWFNTRVHASRSMPGEDREDAITGLIQNPIRVLCEDDINFFGEEYSPNLAESVAFINFFQFPSLKNGKTVWGAVDDLYKKGKDKNRVWWELFDYSLEIIVKVINVIKPDVAVLFAADFCGQYTLDKIRNAINDVGACHVDATYHASDGRVWKRVYNNEYKNMINITPKDKFALIIKDI